MTESARCGAIRRYSPISGRDLADSLSKRLCRAFPALWLRSAFSRHSTRAANSTSITHAFHRKPGACGCRTLIDGTNLPSELLRSTSRSRLLAKTVRYIYGALMLFGKRGYPSQLQPLCGHQCSRGSLTKPKWRRGNTEANAVVFATGLTATAEDMQ